MTDKEDKTSLSLDSEKNLLILAAKACDWRPTDREGEDWIYVRYLETEDKWPFNSFLDSEDCFRLETALELDTVFHEDSVEVFIYPRIESNSIKEYFVNHNGDKDKARRYASTRAAALRGKRE
jgi:hypothetical protein